jgi:hypothetical protein
MSLDMYLIYVWTVNSKSFNNSFTKFWVLYACLKYSIVG